MMIVHHGIIKDYETCFCGRNRHQIGASYEFIPGLIQKPVYMLRSYQIVRSPGCKDAFTLPLPHPKIILHVHNVSIYYKEAKSSSVLQESSGFFFRAGRFFAVFLPGRYVSAGAGRFFAIFLPEQDFSADAGRFFAIFLPGQGLSASAGRNEKTGSGVWYTRCGTPSPARR